MVMIPLVNGVFPAGNPFVCKTCMGTHKVNHRCDRILWKTTVKLEERDSQDDARTRSTRLGRMLRPSKLSNPSSDTVKRHTSIIITPKASTKSLHSRSKNRTASCDLRINPSKEQNGPDPVLAARPRSVSIAGDYQKYSDLTSSKTIRKVLTGPSPESALSGASSKRWLPQLLTKDPRALGTTRSNSLKVKHDPKTSPRQGELVCLSYHTVNDEQMARLEGGSNNFFPIQWLTFDFRLVRPSACHWILRDIFMISG